MARVINLTIPSFREAEPVYIRLDKKLSVCFRHRNGKEDVTKYENVIEDLDLSGFKEWTETLVWRV